MFDYVGRLLVAYWSVMGEERCDWSGSKAGEGGRGERSTDRIIDREIMSRGAKADL